MKNKILILIIIILGLQSTYGNAQILKPISYSDYIKLVYEKNLSIAAEQLNVPIAYADYVASKVFNDPSLSFEYTNNDDNNKQMGQGYSVALSKSFAFGKRRAMMNLAHSEKEISEALLQDFYRKLRFDASLAYLNVVKQTCLYSVKESSYLSMKELAAADSIKFKLGKITEVDAMQSKVEEAIIHNELLQAKNDLYNSLYSLNVFTGEIKKDTVYTSNESFSTKECTVELDELLNIAVNRRADLLSIAKSSEAAEKALKLARIEKRLEFDLSVGYNYNTRVDNETAPAPQFSGITLGVTVPIKFSSLNKGAVNSAKIKANQERLRMNEAELEVKNEVIQSYLSFNSTKKEVEEFDNGLLERSNKVLEGKKYSYNRGETSLLEVLDAQRTYNDIKGLYIETLYNLSAAYMQLQSSIGYN